MADLDCSAGNASMDTKPNDEVSSISESFFKSFYRSEGDKMAQNINTEKSQINESDDSITTGADLIHCSRFKSVPSISPSLKEYFDMVKEEYCKKLLKTKKKSRSDIQVGKPNYSALKGVFFDKATKEITVRQKSSDGIMISSEKTRRKKEENGCSGKEVTNSNKVKFPENSKKDVLSVSLSRSNKKFDRVADLKCFENNLESTEVESSKKSVNDLVSYFENLRRSNSKQVQIKTLNSRRDQKVLEPIETEELSRIKNEDIHFSQSEAKKAKSKKKNKKTEEILSANAAAFSNTEVSNTKFITKNLDRCWTNKNNSYPTFILNDCIAGCPPISSKPSKNRTKSNPSIPASLEEYFDMVKEEYCKKLLKTKRKSRSDVQVGKPNCSPLKGVFSDKLTEEIMVPQKSSNGNTVPLEKTRRKKKEIKNSNKVKLPENSQNNAASRSMSTSNKKFDQVLDLKCFENNLERAQVKSSEQSVNDLVSYFENFRRPSSKRVQMKTPKSRGSKKELEYIETEELSRMRNENIHFSQSKKNKNKNMNEKNEGKSSANGPVSSSTEVSNTKDLARWINKHNSYPTFIINDCITRGPSILPKAWKNRTKRSKFTTINLKSPYCQPSGIKSFGKEATVKFQRSTCKKEKTKKCKKGKIKKRSTEHIEKRPRLFIKNNDKSDKMKDDIERTIRGVIKVVLFGVVVFALAAAVEFKMK